MHMWWQLLVAPSLTLLFFIEWLWAKSTAAVVEEEDEAPTNSIIKFETRVRAFL